MYNIVQKIINTLKNAKKYYYRVLMAELDKLSQLKSHDIHVTCLTAELNGVAPNISRSEKGVCPNMSVTGGGRG